LPGRRSNLEKELKPIEENIVEIMSKAGSDGLRFTEIVQDAAKKRISRPTAARCLSKLIERGVVYKEERGPRKTYYKLKVEALHKKHAQRSLFSYLSMHIFNEIYEEASAGKLTDPEFTERFTANIGLLAMYTLLKGFATAKEDVEEAGKWIEEAFGTLPQKDGWRTCLTRQIFKGPQTLKTPITLAKPVKPELTMENGTIYVTHPLAFKPGLSAQVLKQLPTAIPRKRIDELKNSMKQLYPKEVEILDQILREIETAAKP
jgi:hypothetical protein